MQKCSTGSAPAITRDASGSSNRKSKQGNRFVPVSNQTWLGLWALVGLRAMPAQPAHIHARGTPAHQHRGTPPLETLSKTRDCPYVTILQRRHFSTTRRSRAPEDARKDDDRPRQNQHNGRILHWSAREPCGTRRPRGSVRRWGIGLIAILARPSTCPHHDRGGRRSTSIVSGSQPRVVPISASGSADAYPLAAGLPCRCARRPPEAEISPGAIIFRPLGQIAEHPGGMPKVPAAMAPTADGENEAHRATYQRDGPVCVCCVHDAPWISLDRSRARIPGLFGICGSCTTGEAFAVCAAARASVRVAAHRL